MELTISLDAINDINDLIYWHEPMKIWERIDKKWRDNDLKVYHMDPLDSFEYHADNDSSEKYVSTSQFYEELLLCKFSTKYETFIHNAVQICPEYLMMSQVISDLMKCYIEDQIVVCSDTRNIVERLNELCWRRNFNVIIKENEEYVHSLKSIHYGLSEHLKRSLNVLHLVRNQRAVLYDFAKHGRISTNAFRDDFQIQVQYVCRRLYEDITFGKKTPSKLKSYKLYLYEDVAKNFKTKLLRDVLNMESYFDSHKNSRRLVDIDKLVLDINWWKVEIPQEFSKRIENICWKCMSDLGYISF